MRYREEHRQLAAIMFTDIVGYTALMSASEASALRVLRRSRRLVHKQVRRFRGRWLESIGDGNLVSFASATDAVNCALTIQKGLRQDADVRLRIGIHVGDVIQSAGHIYGDGVNVASRIEALAEPGGIVVSEPVYDAVRNKSGIQADRLGVRELAGLDHPLQIYALSGEAVRSPLLGSIDLPGRRRWTVALILGAVVVAGVFSTGIYSRYGDVQATDTSIAVLPLEDISPDESNRYFAEGISEELINGLARVPGLRVVGRTSSFALGPEVQDVQEIGDKLSVSHVLTGSVRKSGDRVRISAQLVETTNRFQLWADTYETEINDIFKVQQDIGQSIVEALRLKLMPREMADVGRISTRNVQAYDLYLQARSVSREATSRDKYDEAINLLDRALRRDPTFVEAEAAKCEVLVEKYRDTRDSDLMATAVEICDRALTMDPENPMAHIALGNLYLATGRHEFAIESFGRVLPVDPDNADVYLGMAEAFMMMDRPGDARAYYEHAMDIAPENSRVYKNYAWAEQVLGKYERAISLLRKAIEFKPEESSYYSDLGANLFRLGRIEEATEAMMKATRTDPYDKAFNNIGAVLFFGGEYQKSVEMFRKAVGMTPDDARLMAGFGDACRLAPDCEDWREIYRNALELADKRLEVNPEDAYVISLKGVCKAFLGRLEEARRLVKKAQELEPSNSEVMVNTAIVWSLSGNNEMVRRKAEQAISQGYPEVVLRAHPDIDWADSNAKQQARKGGSHEG